MSEQSKSKERVLQCGWFQTWWRHQMETFSALLAICAGNSPVTGGFAAQRPVARSFDVFFDLRLNKRLSKQSWGWWFETPSCLLWRHRNEQLPLVCFMPRQFRFAVGQDEISGYSNLFSMMELLNPDEISFKRFLWLIIWFLYSLCMLLWFWMGTQYHNDDLRFNYSGW